MVRYTGQGLVDSDYPNPSSVFGIQTEGTTYGDGDVQVTANTTYLRYNYQHAATSDTKLLIHSNTDIDGDTSITDASPSAHLLDRVVADPVYANSGVNRSSLAGASYNGIYLNGKDVLSVSNVNKTYDVPANIQYTIAFWVKPTAVPSWATYFGGKAYGSTADELMLGTQGDGTVFGFEAQNSGTSGYPPTASITSGTWQHFVLTRSSNDLISWFKNGSAGNTTDGPGGAGTAFAFSRLIIGGGSGDFSDEIEAYMDQIMFIKGTALSSGKISGRIAKEIFELMQVNNENPEKIVETKGLLQQSDPKKLEKIIINVISNNKDKVEQYKSGKEKLFGFFVGQVMKLSGGKANPQLVNEILKNKLKSNV